MVHVERVVNATLYPVISSHGGVLDADGAFVRSAAYSRFGKEYIFAPEPLPHDGRERLAGEFIFGGYLMRQFGHFLLESLARLVLANERPDLPVIWIRQNGLRPFQADALALLGVGNEHVFVRTPSDVDVLLVPDAGFEIAEKFTSEHARFLGCVAPPSSPAGGKLWLSRSALAPDLSHVVEEAEIEAELARAGWTIYHPEQHGLREQLAALNNADEIAGFIGSAFHSLVLLETVHATVTIFGTNQRRNATYRTIAATKNFKQREVDLEFATVGGTRSKPHLSVMNPSRLFDALSVADVQLASTASVPAETRMAAPARVPEARKRRRIARG